MRKRCGILVYREMRKGHLGFTVQKSLVSENDDRFGPEALISVSCVDQSVIMTRVIASFDGDFLPVTFDVRPKALPFPESKINHVLSVIKRAKGIKMLAGEERRVCRRLESSSGAYVVECEYSHSKNIRALEMLNKTLKALDRDDIFAEAVQSVGSDIDRVVVVIENIGEIVPAKYPKRRKAS